MTAQTKQAPPTTKTSSTAPIVPQLGRFALLIALDAAVVWFFYKLLSLGYFPFAAAILIIMVGVNIVLLLKKAYPLRWMVAGLVLMGLFTIYPIIFTIWVSFTNYGEGHLVTEEQAINQILKMKYLPATGMSYTWTAYKSPQGDYVLWLQDAAGNGYLAKPGEPISQPKPGESGVGELDNKGIPTTIEGYQRLNVLMAATDKNLTEILFGEAGKTIQVRSPSEAAELLPLYIYDPGKDAMINQETGTVYQNLRGSFYIARWH